ncbi:WS/DGAT domain-containing protein [Actinotalea sp. M2MS4P-6]|uniref:wax ester/triacylglycerol synthase domain-containing protein n=1 Tax=Actinotalea sp. M2MS4P-6 TaxID=2983762 RepID=UPI0021E477C3|nr:wax ester/triacylglycerol synthase domain-containing protein [Actinotalea sp. M2MS4P-6]MCV2393606.1 WS/DGAT domain-containing protein [Actinotalea sp. M2MS4P-6]
MPPKDRISAADAVELATDVGPAPRNVGVVLLLDGGDPAAVAETVHERLAGVPAFRRRLVVPRFGRPYWVDAAGTANLVRRQGAPSGADPDLVAAAATVMVERLDPAAPLWRAVVHEHAGAAVAVTLVMHHVLADGIGGLAVLADLADEGPAPGPSGPGPSVGAPTASASGASAPAASAPAVATRTRPGRLHRLRSAFAELSGPRTAPRCSLNAPSGPDRAAHHVEVPLDPVRTGARARGGTINDALLVAAGDALGRTLAERGEHLDDVVVSVAVSARRSTTRAELGNRVGVMTVRVPLTGDLGDRLHSVAADSRRRKTSARGASAALLGPAFRLLAATGLFQWFVDRQRMVTTFLTNLRGPAEVHLGGVRVRALVPIGILAGNVTVAFAALSYAGRLGVTVVSDPAVVPEGDRVAERVRAALTELSTG